MVDKIEQAVADCRRKNDQAIVALSDYLACLVFERDLARQ